MTKHPPKNGINDQHDRSRILKNNLVLHFNYQWGCRDRARSGDQARSEDRLSYRSAPLAGQVVAQQARIDKTSRKENLILGCLLSFAPKLFSTWK